MQTEILSLEERRRELKDVLLSRLSALAWPGADGLTVEDVLLSYPAAAARRQVPAYPKLLVAHPELSRELEAFFASPAEWLSAQAS